MAEKLKFVFFVLDYCIMKPLRIYGCMHGCRRPRHWAKIIHPHKIQSLVINRGHALLTTA